MGLDINSPPIPTTVANQKVMICLLDFFKTELRDLFMPLRNEFNDPSTISTLAASIAEISCSGNDHVRLNVYSRPSKTNKSIQVEAFSRRIIDQFALLIHQTFRKLGLASYDIVEFRIASSDTPVEIVRGGFRTILTGDTDYGIFMRGKPDPR